MRWGNEQLRHLARVQVSNVDKKSLDGEQAVSLCNYTDVYYNDRITRSLDFMGATASAGQVRSFQLGEGDILLTKDSETADDIGVPAYVAEDLPGVLCGYHLALLRSFETVHAPFLYWAIRSDFVRDQLAVSATGVTRFGLTYDALKGLVIPLPPIETQRRIADFLDDQIARMDRAITLRDRQVRDAKNLLVSVVHAAVTGGVVDHRVRANRWALPWAPALPGHWGTPRICQVAQLGTGHTPSRDRPELWEGADIPWLTTADVYRFRGDQIDVIHDTEHHISPLGIANSAAVMHPAGTVALSRTSASAGFSIVMGAPMATSQDYATWTCGPQVIPEFLLWCLRAMRGDLLGRLAMGSTHKTIYFPDLMGIRIPLPPIGEQEDAIRQIAETADSSRSLQESFSSARTLLEERKAALITGAVTGEFDVVSASPRSIQAAKAGVGGAG